MLSVFRRIRTLALACVAALLTSSAGAQATCTPPDSSPAAQRTPLAAGHYRLTLVATAGPVTNRQATGLLDLWPATPTDRSPRTGQRAKGDIRRTPLFGATDLDFRAVNAPVVASAGDVEPPPASGDPVFPGVLVVRDHGQDFLFISTVSNPRTGEDWLDGTGIILRVLRSADGLVVGTWDRAGLLVASRGHFCAERLGPPPERAPRGAP